MKKKPQWKIVKAEPPEEMMNEMFGPVLVNLDKLLRRELKRLEKERKRMR